MNRSMINAGASMYGLQQKLDILANNIANVNTVGYKKKEANFQDILTNVAGQTSDFERPGRLTPMGYTQGWGSWLADVHTNLSQGPIKGTDSPLDFAIEGDALFQVGVAETDENGEPSFRSAYTRTGSFQLSPSETGEFSYLTTQEGYPVMGILNGQEQPIRIPANHAFAVDGAGNIMARSLANPNGAPVQLGQMKLVQAVQPDMLESVGDNLFVLSAQADNTAIRALNLNTADAVQGQPSVRQGFLEQSNVTLSDEMAELMVVQRAYQLNSRALTSSDTMAGLANNLRG
jgi:flagellar basal-body rod protein FlgG